MKRIIALSLTLILLVSLCACGGKGGAKEIDLEALAQELTAAGIFTDTMSRAADDLPARIYGLAEGDAALPEEALQHGHRRVRRVELHHGRGEQQHAGLAAGGGGHQ